jgi:hypothetical protein
MFQTTNQVHIDAEKPRVSLGNSSANGGCSISMLLQEGIIMRQLFPNSGNSTDNGLEQPLRNGDLDLEQVAPTENQGHHVSTKQGK